MARMPGRLARMLGGEAAQVGFVPAPLTACKRVKELAACSLARCALSARADELVLSFPVGGDLISVHPIFPILHYSYRRV